MSFVSVLTVLFIALKLTEVIDWSWIWVLAPLWMSLCFYVGFYSTLEVMQARRKRDNGRW